MIRKFEPSDMNVILDIWLKASVKAHDFVGREYWESRLDDMRNIYMPASETYVFSESGSVRGFFSLHGENLAAIFVYPEDQGRGIGKRMIEKAKSLRSCLRLSVYKENAQSVKFYKKCGFKPIDERSDHNTGHVEIVMEYQKSTIYEYNPVEQASLPAVKSRCSNESKMV